MPEKRQRAKHVHTECGLLFNKDLILGVYHGKLKNEEYLIGVVVVDGVSVGIRPDITITPKGIQYLEENSLLQKAKETVKDIRDMLPI